MKEMIIRNIKGVLFCGVLLSSVVASALGKSEDKKLKKFADEYLSHLAMYEPESVVEMKLKNTRHDIFNDHSLNGVFASQSYIDKKFKALRKIKLNKLSDDSKLTYNVVYHSLESSINSRVCKKELWDILTISPWFSELTTLAEFQPLGTPKARNDALKRWHTFGKVTDDEIAKLKAGLEAGYTVPQETVPRVISQIDGLLEMPVKASPFFVPGDRDLDKNFQEEFVAIVQNEVYPNLRKFKNFLENEYMPNARKDVGVSAHKNGLECYKASIKELTTKSTSPQEIFDLGQAEVAVLFKRLDAIGKEHFDGMKAKDLLQYAEKANKHFKSEQDVLDYNYAALERVKAVLPQLMTVSPKSDFVIKPYPQYLAENGAPGEYHEPSADGSKPGIFYINTYDFENLSYAAQESTLFHEGIPGHHLQLAFLVENPNVHPIARLLFNSGSVEGWALYSEKLAAEFNLFSEPIAEVGHISDALMRASRLVVDTGMHAFGWTREEAVQFLREHTTVPEHILWGEVDRYITWPAQATAYYLGMNEILSVRQYAEAKLGSQFSLPAFNDEVLKAGPVPLEVMSAKVKKWVNSQSK